MEIVYLILIFIAPGLICETIKESMQLKKMDRSKDNIYKQMFNIVINSIIISTIVLLFLYLRKHLQAFNTFEELFAEMNNMFIIGRIVIGIVIMSIIWAFLRVSLFSKIILFFKLKTIENRL